MAERSVFPELACVVVAGQAESFADGSADRSFSEHHGLVHQRGEHALQDASGPLLTEWHDIVYRESPTPGSAPPPAKPAPDNAVWTWGIEPDPVLLFRY